jgi:multiple sugar transport system permease protein
MVAREWPNLLAKAVLFVVALVMLAPLLWMISTSLKPESEIFLNVPRWIPWPVTFHNYQELANRAGEAPVFRWLFNSVFVATSHTMLVLFVDSLAAYAFARLTFPGREPLFMLVVATMIIPGQVTLIPVFLIIQKLHWFNTYQALIVPGAAGGFGVFLLRQFLLGIPRDLEEAAQLDGCGRWTIYWRVILPLARPALATLAIFSFLGSWNDFMWPLIITNEIAMRTLPIGITIFQGRYTTEYGVMMAAATVATLPVILAFLLFQKQIIKGIALSGLKA